jgi:hypothetical protein
VPYEYSAYQDEFSGFYDPNDIGFAFDDENLYDAPDDLLDGACKLLRDTINRGLPVAAATNFVQSNVKENPILEQALQELLEGPWDSDLESFPQFRVSIVGQALEQLAASELSPLDAFAALNFMRSQLLNYAQKEWKDVDFIANAAKVDETLGKVVMAALRVMQRANHPLSTALFEATTAEVPESKPLLMLNEAIADGLMLIGQAVGQACCDAKIGATAIQPVLTAFPELPVYDPILAAHLSEALLPVIKGVAASEELKSQLLALPHTAAKVDVNSMVKAVQDLAALTHFMNSPIAMLAETHAPRLHTELNMPSITPEAMELYEVARETANLLWNLDENANASLANEISELAATFYNQYLGQLEDATLGPLARNSYQGLAQALKEASAIIGDGGDLHSLLKPGNALHAVTLALLDSQADFMTTASLLALESMDEKQRRELIGLYGQAMDAKLRAISGPVSDVDRQQFQNLFKLFAMGTLSLTPPSSALAARAKLAEVGALLMGSLADALLSEEARKDRCAQIRNALRPLLAINDESLMDDLLQRFLGPGMDSSNPKTYVIKFTLKAPDLSLQTSTLKKLMAKFTEFEPRELVIEAPPIPAPPPPPQA